jgi:hypothetical protein
MSEIIEYKYFNDEHEKLDAKIDYCIVGEFDNTRLINYQFNASEEYLYSYSRYFLSCNFEGNPLRSIGNFRRYNNIPAENSIYLNIIVNKSPYVTIQPNRDTKYIITIVDESCTFVYKYLLMICYGFTSCEDLIYSAKVPTNHLIRENIYAAYYRYYTIEINDIETIDVFTQLNDIARRVY